MSAAMTLSLIACSSAIDPAPGASRSDLMGGKSNAADASVTVTDSDAGASPYGSPMPGASTDAGTTLGAAVWRPDSVAFSMTDTSGGYPAAFTECSTSVEVWTFDSTSGQLTKTGCENGTVLNRTGVATADQRAQILTSLQGLQTTAPGTIADAPEVQLAVTDASGRVSSYSGYTWFPSSSATPTVSSTPLFLLQNLLDSIVERPTLLGEWCSPTLACASGLVCAVGDAGSAQPYCQAGP
jgi:hypothetical protein